MYVYLELFEQFLKNKSIQEGLSGFSKQVGSLTRFFKSQILQKSTICDVLHNLIAFVQFQKRGKHIWRTVFHVFKIVQMVPNRAKHHICFLVISELKSLIKYKVSHILQNCDRVFFEVFKRQAKVDFRGLYEYMRSYFVLRKLIFIIKHSVWYLFAQI